MSRRRYAIPQPRGTFRNPPWIGAAPIAPPRPPTYVRRSLPNRILKIRRGRFFQPVRLPENNSPQALPPIFMRQARTHQKLRNINRGGFFSYPVLETAPQPIPTPPPDALGGSYSPGWRRRIWRKRRRPMVTGYDIL